MARRIRARIRKDRCKRTGKVSFVNELEAKMALAIRQANDKGEIRTYRCGNHWHLTSQEKRHED